MPCHVGLALSQVCRECTARHVTYDDAAAPASPFFWCSDCFRQMHYDAAGRARYTDFKVFPYTMERHRLVTRPGERGGAGGGRLDDHE